MRSPTIGNRNCYDPADRMPQEGRALEVECSILTRILSEERKIERIRGNSLIYTNKGRYNHVREKG
jgi:hypothetical protein